MVALPESDLSSLTIPSPSELHADINESHCIWFTSIGSMEGL